MAARAGVAAIMAAVLAGVSACTPASGASGGGGPGGNAAAAAPAGGFSFASDPCQAAFDSLVAQARVPYAASITATRPGAPTLQSDSRQIGGVSYYQQDGQWKSTPQSIDQAVADLTATRKAATETCKASGDDTVAGKPVTIYDVHEVNGDTTTENRLWIAKDNGLPLKAQTQMEDGTVLSLTFSYDNVTPPPGM